MKVSDALRSSWSAAESDASNTAGHYRRRIECAGPLPVYAGVGIPEMLRRISLRMPLAALGSGDCWHSTRGFDVLQENPSADYPGDAVVHIIESAAPLPKDLFLIFCGDVLEHVSRGDSPASGVRILQSRLQHWRRFFQGRPEEGLSREQYIGLYSELEFLERCLGGGIPADCSVVAWSGPLGTNQDFLFGPVAVEVKATTGNDPDIVRIANVRQLDDTGLHALYLAHTAYDFRKDAGRTLGELVNTLRAVLQPSPAALTEFEERLSFAGYSEPEKGVCIAHGFARRSGEDFRVTEEFPRLLEERLPEGVSDVTYSIHLSSAAAFKLDLGVLMTELLAAYANV